MACARRCIRTGDRLAIYSRTLDDVTHRFPELHDALRALPGSFVLDGEIVGVRDGRARVALQPLSAAAWGVKTSRTTCCARFPPPLSTFDLLYRDGDLLFARPLTERRALLAALLGTEDIISPLTVARPMPGTISRMTTA